MDILTIAPILRMLLKRDSHYPIIRWAADKSTQNSDSLNIPLPKNATVDDVIRVITKAVENVACEFKYVNVQDMGVFEVIYPSTISRRVSGKIVLVTGGAQGFGLEIARALVAQGAYIVLTDINIEQAHREASDLNDAYGKNSSLAVTMDVTNSTSVRQAIAATINYYGGLDVLISNAGVLKAESVKTQPEKDFDLVTAVNYKGYYLCVRAVAPVLALQHRVDETYMSDIIQINSKSGLQGSNRNFAYAGGKFGGIGLTQSFALELIEDGIKVNSVCPGNYFDGPLWSDPENGLFVQYLRTGKVPGAKTIEDVRRAYEQKVPMKRGCRAEDVMTAIYYLIEQCYETGQAIAVTGGQVMLH